MKAWRRRSEETNEAIAGCIAGTGCLVTMVILNILFWGALLWMLIQVLKWQHVIR